MSISGPWTLVTSLQHLGGPPGNYEDAFFYNDKGFTCSGMSTIQTSTRHMATSALTLPYQHTPTLKMAFRGIRHPFSHMGLVLSCWMVQQ
jgi:hypothetical protein